MSKRGDPGASLALITAPDVTVAERLARSLVDQRLAACVNLVPGIRSIYRWQGSVEDGHEILLLVKTREERLAEIERQLARLHPYEVPELISVRISQGSAPYLEWLCREASE